MISVAFAFAQAQGALSELAKLLPNTATRVAADDAGERFGEVRVTELREGDLVLVRPGARVPADGAVQSGRRREQDAEHPVARAIVESAREGGLEIPRAQDFEAIPGFGGRAVVDGRSLVVGGPNLLTRQGARLPPEFAELTDRNAPQGRGVVYLLENDRVLAAFAVADAIRPESAEAVRPDARARYRGRHVDRRLRLGGASRCARVAAPGAALKRGRLCSWIGAADARGESRTRTGLPPADFESAASAIPPLGRAGKITRAPLGWPPDAGLDFPFPTSEPRAWSSNHPARFTPGFLPRTLGEDGDPLDVLVLMTTPVFTGCLVDARPIGLFHLVDRGAADEKVLAVSTGDPYSEGLGDLGDIPKHYLKEIEHFFQVYKDLEGTRTETRGFEGAGAARGAVERPMELYRGKFDLSP